jgi:hypothetical protein
VYFLCAVFVFTALLGACLIFFFMDSYEKIGIKNLDKQLKSPLNLLLNTLNHMKNINQQLIIPLTLYSGFEQAFIGADFTKSFISCIKGIESVGVIMIVYGLADTLGINFFNIKYNP